MMNRLLRLSLPIFVWLASSPALAQEVAGRVLVAAGNVVIQRGAEKISARRGTEVRSGDTFLLGEKSNAQIRLTDDSIIALRSKTTFRLSQYAFVKDEPKKQRAFFDLLAGGLRTITGLIGRTQRDSYLVTTPTATVGIRGTHYALRYCNNDCYKDESASASAEPVKLAAVGRVAIGPFAQADSGGGESGPLLPNGLHGTVIAADTERGRIVVKNEGGERVFGADQHFWVRSLTTPPQETIAPFPGITGKLEGSTSDDEKQTAEGAQAEQQQGTKGGGGESGVTVVAPFGDIGIAGKTTGYTNAAVGDVDAVRLVGSLPASEARDLSGIIQTQTLTGIKYYGTSGTFVVTHSELGQVVTEVLTGDITLAVNYDRGIATFSVNVQNTFGDIWNFGSTFAGVPVTQSGGVATINGEFTTRVRCTGSSCVPGGELVLLRATGTISGTTANLTLTPAIPGAGDLGDFVSATLTLVTPPNNSVAAIAIPFPGFGTNKRSGAFSGVDVDGSGRLLRLGPTVGQPMANVGSAQNLVNGSDPAYGLTWGHWVWPGQSFVDSNYQNVSPTFATTTFGVNPWITGQISSSIPSSGTVTYSPIGAAISSGYGKLNSATLTIDFLNLMAAVDINATKWIGFEAGNTFQMNGTSAFSPATTRFGNSFSSITCSGGPCNGGVPPTGSFSGFLSGSNAQGAGLVFGVGWATSGVGGSVALAAGAGPMTPDPQFTGVKYYNILGPVSIPAVLNGSPTTVTMNVATIRVDYRNGVQSTWDFNGARLQLEDGTELVMRTQFGAVLPATIEGKNVNFSAGSSSGFYSVIGLCESCGPGGTAANLQYGFAAGSITGNTATFVFSGQDSGGNTRSFSANLTETAPFTKWGGIAIPTSDGSSVLSRALWAGNSSVDTSGRLLNVALGGTPNEGRGSAYVGTATNTIVGSDASAGNLVWGTWNGGGAELIGSDFVKYTTGPTAVQPWITGTLPSAFPNSNSVTYSPVGQVINNGFATLNVAVINANFVNRSMVVGVDFTRTSGELNRWIITGGSGVDGAGRFGGGIPTASISCSGGPCTSAASATAGFEGHFSGPNAEGAGLVFSVGSGIGNGGTGVVGFTRQPQ